jgi:uncharacterized damage-inducible protein DinB
MTVADVLTDSFERVREAVHEVTDNLSPEEILFQVDEGSNSIGWLVWHLTRIEDDHVAAVAGRDQDWIAHGWADRFGLPYEKQAHGYGHSPADVAAFSVGSAELLVGYHDAVHARTLDYVSGLSDADLARVVDTRWDPPVTLSVRLVSVISDGLQHAGQAAFIRGIVERR